MAIVLSAVLFSCSEYGGSGAIEVFLRNQNYTWIRDSEADYLVDVPLNNGRTQKVFIRHRIFHEGRTFTREMMSVAQTLTEDPLPGFLSHLLQDSALTQIWGHWALIPGKGENKFLVVYITKIPSSSGGAILRQALLSTASSADRWERLTTSLDQY